jgi:hypothetical protein
VNMGVPPLSVSVAAAEPTGPRSGTVVRLDLRVKYRRTTPDDIPGRGEHARLPSYNFTFFIQY